MRQCLGCGKPLVKRSQKVFCSFACQRSLERVDKTALWLRTGIATTSAKPDHYIRIYISDEQNGCCALCGLADEWEGQQLNLVLDHIDGDPTNNHRDNLRLICPNCDSQLPTYKGRNRGNGRHYRRERYANGQSY